MIDLEKAEREFRAQIAEVQAQGEKALAEGRAEKSFLEAQNEFIEATVSVHLTIMRCLNKGMNKHDIAAALGVFMGGISASVEKSFTVEEASIMYEMAERTITDVAEDSMGDTGAHSTYHSKDEAAN